jgi:ABC-type uncharacterized transport system fused permease/ATPase subunit
MFRVFDQMRGVNLIKRDIQLNVSEKIYRLNKKFLRHIASILTIIFPRLFCLSTFLFVFLLVIVVALELIVYQVGLLSGKYYKVLANKNLSEFTSLTILSIVLIVVNALVKSLVYFASNLLRIVWRTSLTTYLNQNYFANKNFYFIQLNFKNSQVIKTPIRAGLAQSASHRLDNPDQRITQDVDNIFLSMSNIIPILLVSPFVIGYYAYKVFCSRF